MKFRENKNPCEVPKITLSFTDVSKSCPSREFLTWQLFLLMLLRKFPNLQYKQFQGNNECMDQPFKHYLQSALHKCFVH